MGVVIQVRNICTVCSLEKAKFPCLKSVKNINNISYFDPFGKPPSSKAIIPSLLFLIANYGDNNNKPVGRTSDTMMVQP